MTETNYNLVTPSLKDIEEEPIIEEIVEVVYEDVEEPITEPQPKEWLGQVVDCQTLNIRETPAGTILGTVDCGKTVLIEEAAGRDWLHIHTEHGLEGYVMRKYIKED